ncbi:MAG: asparaginase domain-containing protein [Planctomycetota bacterium]
MRIKILSCGGTIDKVYFDSKSEFEVGEPQIESVFREANVTYAFEIESLMRKDSLDMTDEDRQLIADRVRSAEERHILITHGTDTMAQTARALLQIPGKVMVLTGSMTPARFRATDAIFNIGCAVGALQASAPGVYIAMSGRVIPGELAEKDRQRQIFFQRDST